MRRRYGMASHEVPECILHLRLVSAVTRMLGVAVLAGWLPAIAWSAPGAQFESPTVPTIAAPVPLGTAPPDSVSASGTRPDAGGHRVVHPPVPTVTIPAIDPPSDLRRVSEWITFRSRRHLASLPTEARLFYRRGLLSHQAGQFADAMLDVRGATELDPSFVEPHLTLALWTLTTEPGQALQQAAAALELVRQDFNAQLDLLANTFLIAFQALFAGLLFAAMIVVWLRRDEITHDWRENLERFGTRSGARIWAPALLFLPYLAGFGLTIPTLGFLAYLWPSLRVRERVLSVLLAAAVFAIPTALRVSERLSLPLHQDAPPFFGVSLLENGTYSAEREARLAALAAANQDNALLQFGYALTARRGTHLAQAEQAYRRILTRWPNSDRAWNNLGNVLAMRGRGDEALDCFKNAIGANPRDAAAYYNWSQLLTQRYEYQGATDALSRASALNFDLVRRYQAQASADGLLPLIDEWVEPRALWQTLRQAPLPAAAAGVIPVSLRRNIEVAGWPFMALVLFAIALGAACAWHQHKRIHLRACSNCGAVICRRCAQRRREHALCTTCSETEAEGETPEFARLLLLKRRRARQRRSHLLDTALAATIPGYGLIAYRQMFAPTLLLSISWLIVNALTGIALPFALQTRLAFPGQDLPLLPIIGGIVLVYAASLLGYFRLAAQAQARELALTQTPMRGRVQQSTRRTYQAAA